MNGNTRRRTKSNINNRTSRAKGTLERNVVIDGIYGNARFMHMAVSLLVGNVVQVETIHGSIYEGILRTFSPQFDTVLEMAHKVDKNLHKLGQTSIPNKDAIMPKIVFRTPDVVLMTCINTDMDHVAKEFFATDTTISKFSVGQVSEKELEPWDGGAAEVEDFPSLDTESANGWDVNEMFRTNEVQYGVQTTYDSTLAGYTTALEKKNTDEYKKQEAKALRIANEIESSASSKARTALENGDEDERLSSVVRPVDGHVKCVPPVRRKPQPGGVKMPRSSPPQSACSGVPMGRALSMGHPHSHGPPAFNSHMVSSNMVSGMSSSNPSHASPPSSSSASSSSPSSPPSSASSSLASVRGSGLGPGPSPNVVHMHQMPPHVHQLSHSGLPLPPAAVMTGQHVAAQSIMCVGNQMVVPGHEVVGKVNGGMPDEKGVDRDEGRGPALDNEIKQQVASREVESKASADALLSSGTHIVQKGPRKNLNQKMRDDKDTVKNLKDFHIHYKLVTKDPSKLEQDNKDKSEGDVEKISSTLKKSTLNPNAKEFVLNPNAKAFTPRSPGSQAPTPPRAHTPSAVYSAPTPIPVMPGQPIFTNMPTQYIVSGPTSVSIPSSHFSSVATLQQGQRFRKPAPSNMSARPEFPPVQVAAATGQPILAPQFVQYTGQGMVPVPSVQQHNMQYSQLGHMGPQTHFMQLQPMVNPRMVSPQMTLVQNPHASGYQDAQHVPSQIYVSAHHGVPTSPHPGTMSMSAMTPTHGQHSTTPNHQSQNQAPTQGMHPNAASGHQQSQNQTNQAGGGNPQQQQQQMQGGSYQQQQQQQPQLQPSPHTPNSPQAIHPSQTPTGSMQQQQGNPHHFHPGQMVSHGGSPHVGQGHPHASIQQLTAAFPSGGSPQQMVLVQQGHGGQGGQGTLQGHPQGVQAHHTLQGHALQGHGNPGQVTHLIQHASLGMIPATSGAGSMPAQHHLYIPHPGVSGASLPHSSFSRANASSIPTVIWVPSSAVMERGRNQR